MGSISLEEFDKLRSAGVPGLDCRPTNDFAKSHIENTINASINGSFEYMVYCFFNKDDKFVLIGNPSNSAEAFLRLESEGYLDLHIFHYELWNKETLSLERVKAKNAKSHLSVMKDVSNAEDWELLHVKGVKSVPLKEIVKTNKLILDGDVLYCGNGHKSMAAVSYLRSKNIVTTDIIGGLSAMLVESPDLEI
jgi:rhodanese-related sulfurtransferase